jgi:hypothetical protein
MNGDIAIPKPETAEQPRLMGGSAADPLLYCPRLLFCAITAGHSHRDFQEQLSLSLIHPGQHLGKSA